MRAHDMAAVALTANVEAPIKEHADIVLDYGVGVESVDFVTLGVEVLVEYLVLFGIYGGQARGTIDAKGVAQRLDDLREAIQANAVMCKTAEAYVQDHMLELSEHMPAMVVGNGPNYGVAEEAALKLSETIKIPAMHHEGEEFVHGPDDADRSGPIWCFIRRRSAGVGSVLRISPMRYRTLRQKRCCSRPIPKGRGSRGCGASGGSAAQRNSQSCVLPDDCGR